jgi:hypothetical protein
MAIRGASHGGGNDGRVMAATSVYSTRFRIVAALLVTLAVTAFVLAYFIAQEGGDDPVLESGGVDFVEELFPQRNAQVPQQSSVGIDLESDWTGTLIVNGVEIPQDQLQVTDELGLIQYTPGEGRAVEELRGGTNSVTAVVWPRSETRETGAQDITWTFEVV